MPSWIPWAVRGVAPNASFSRVCTRPKDGIHGDTHKTGDIFMGISWTMGININKHGYVLGVYIYIYDYICDFLTNMGFVLGEYHWDIRYHGLL